MWKVFLKCLKGYKPKFFYLKSYKCLREQEAETDTTVDVRTGFCFNCNVPISLKGQWTDHALLV